MSDEQVEVQYGENASDTAVLLLAAAEELDLDPSVVRTSEGRFVVPKEVADKASISDDPEKNAKKAEKKRDGLRGIGPDDPSQDAADYVSSGNDDEPKAPAKKTAAKKTAAGQATTNN